MPVSWTPDNDRKLLLLMLKSAGVIHVNLAETRRLWGPDAPTEHAIRLRSQHLKKMARDSMSATPEATSTPNSTPRKITTTPKKWGGLITPNSSPKTGAKRKLELSPDDEVSTPRPRSTRKAAQHVTYQEPDTDTEMESDGEATKSENLSSVDSDDDEYNPDSGEDREEVGGGDESDLEKQVGIERELCEEHVALKPELLKPVELMDTAENVSSGGEAELIKMEACDMGSIALLNESNNGDNSGASFHQPMPGKGFRFQFWV